MGKAIKLATDVVSLPEPLGPFNRFGYFRLVYVCSIFFFDSIDPSYLDEKKKKKKKKKKKEN